HHPSRGGPQRRQGAYGGDWRRDDLADQDLGGIRSLRRDLPKDVAIRDQADRTTVLDAHQLADFFRGHAFRRVEDRAIRVDDDDVTGHHVPDEDHRLPPSGYLGLTSRLSPTPESRA